MSRGPSSWKLSSVCVNAGDDENLHERLAHLFGPRWPSAATADARAVVALRSAKVPTMPRDTQAAPAFVQSGVSVCAEGDTLFLEDAQGLLVVHGDGSVEASFRTAAAAPGCPALSLAIVLALRAHRVFHMHAAGLVTSGGTTVLVAGVSGAGKSSTTLALLEAGARLLSDDALLIDASNPSAIHAYPCGFHVGERTVEAMPRLRAHTRGSYRADVRKVILDADEAYPGARIFEAPRPKVCVFPRIEEGVRTQLVPTDQATMFGRLLEAGGWLFYPHMAHKEAQLQATEHLVRGARGFTLVLGPDALDDSSIVATCIERAVAP